MALVYLYSRLKDGDTFTTNQKKSAQVGTNIVWKYNLCAPGDFSLDIPASSDLVEFIDIGDIISINNTNFGIIRQALKRDSQSSSIITISGEDLKGYMQQRITLYPKEVIAEGLQGYDAIKDVSTEAVVKHFFKNNVTEPANDKRRIPAFFIAENKNRGKEKDQYMSRFETLHDLLLKNLEPQKMGYSVTPDFESNHFIFDVIQGTDRTSQQDINPRILFNISHKNLLSIEYSISRNNFCNTFYASLSKGKNENETLTCMYTPNDEAETSGADRFEMHLNVSANLPAEQLYENMKQYAMKDASKYEEVENILAVPTDKFEFGKDYFLGDYVTLEAKTGFLRYKKVLLDVQITGVNERWLPSGKIETTLEFGKSRPTRFDILSQQIQNNG